MLRFLVHGAKRTQSAAKDQESQYQLPSHQRAASTCGCRKSLSRCRATSDCCHRLVEQRRKTVSVVRFNDSEEFFPFRQTPPWKHLPNLDKRALTSSSPTPSTLSALRSVHLRQSTTVSLVRLIRPPIDYNMNFRYSWKINVRLMWLQHLVVLENAVDVSHCE